MLLQAVQEIHVLASKLDQLKSRSPHGHRSQALCQHLGAASRTSGYAHTLRESQSALCEAWTKSVKTGDRSDKGSFRLVTRWTSGKN